MKSSNNHINQRGRILIIEDNETMRQGMAAVLNKQGCYVVEADSGASGIAQFKQSRFDLVVTDYKLGDFNGIEILQNIKSIAPETEVMLITAYGTIELAVQAMQKGAADFINKPFSHEEFTFKVLKILNQINDRNRLERVSDEITYLRSELEVKFNFGEIVGDSSAMNKIYAVLSKVALTDSSVIIYGESGTGKELVARAIHKASARKRQPFIRVNCGALPENLLESELFGHERGAFTGALKRKKGRFELANHGTIFLDEIGDISASTQLRLLRVLQEREFELVGGESTVSVDVRVIAATNKDLKALVSDGKFREDLYYRLHIIPITIPPLRERKDDIPVLITHFLKKLSVELHKPNLKLEADALQALAGYDWPGNVRELENILERAAVLCEHQCIRLSDIPPLHEEGLMNHPSLLEGDSLELNSTLGRIEKQFIEKALEKSNGNKTKAAQLLGIKTSALYYKLEKYGFIGEDWQDSTPPGL
ncbi:sigma-54-dependent Fis family transcriptional regulator [candidate division KSB1 bacterium]|nr:sigma-54-dependent Fis family transcriptional regulator [candidate division KSB1 bacterium]